MFDEECKRGSKIQILQAIYSVTQRYWDMKNKTKLQRELVLKINACKTKEMKVNSDVESRLTVNRDEVEQVKLFLYLREV